MRSSSLFAAVAATLPFIANAALDCGSNLTASGNDWTVTCDYVLEAENEQLVAGEPDLESCLEACVEGNDCYGVNFAPNGSCILASGDERGARQETGYSNLLRLAEPTASSTSTSHVKITSTIYGPGITPTTFASRTTSAPNPSLPSTGSNAPGSGKLCSVDLDLKNICPTCNGLLADVNGTFYIISCDSALESSAGFYFLQKAVSPGGCLEECNKDSFCQGADYTDYEDCAIAKGPASAVSSAGITAFLPVAAPTATQLPSAFPTGTFTPITTHIATSPVSTLSTVEPVYSILPVPNYCDQTAPTCPECNGAPVQDKLNSSYTMGCFEPVCDSTVIRDNASSQEACMEECDQDVTCLAAVWFADNTTCNLCQQGLDSVPGVQDSLPFVVFVAEQNDDDDSTTTSLASSITALPTPFAPSSSQVSTTLRTRKRPVLPGYVPLSSTFNLSTAGSLIHPKPLVTGINPGGPIINITFAPAPSASPLPISGYRPGGPIINLTSPSVTPVPITGYNPGGPIIQISSTSSPSAMPVPITGFNPGGPIRNISSSTTSSVSSTTAEIPHITNLPPVACPNYDGDVFIDDDEDFFEIECNKIFDAVHSRYVSASDLPGCVASCTGDCDGVQFGYTSRCGLYTTINSVVSATGWTIAAKIELPTSVPALATPTPVSQAFSSIVGTGSVPQATSSGILPPYSNSTRH